MINRLYLIAICIVCVSQLAAQRKGVDKVVEFNIRDVKPILENNKVKGYYFFYKVERVDMDESVFALKLFDENLGELGVKEFTLNTSTQIIGVVYNGNIFCLQLLDPSDRQYEIIIYDKNFEETGRANVRLSKDQAEDAADHPNYAKSMIPLPGVGFALKGLSIKTDKEEFVVYNEAGNEVWDTGPANPEKLGYASMTLIKIEKNTAVFYETCYKGIMGFKNSKKYIRILDLNNGEEILFKELVVDSDKWFGLTDIETQDNGYLLIGTFASKKDPQNDIGFVLINMDNTGNVLSQKNVPISRELNKLIPDEYTRNRIKNHQVGLVKYINLQSKIFFVCLVMEQIAAVDFFILEVDKEFAIKDFYFPKVSAEANPILEYYFTSINPNETEFTSVFSPKEKGKDSQSDFVGSVKYSMDKGFKSSVIKLTNKPSEYTILKAKEGYVTIFEYFKKDKKVDFHIEKFD